MSEATATVPVEARPAAGDVLWVEGVSKGFPGVQALDGVDLRVGAGEVLALIGENGAGKSTLVKILTGIYRPDAGVLKIAGETVSFANPYDAARAGISAIHQESMMFEDLTVAENIFLGNHPKGGRLRAIDWSEMARQASRLLAALNIDLDPTTLIKSTSIAERHLVAVAKALSHDAKIIIFDEPTAALSQNEIEYLFGVVRNLRDAGKAIIFISHKFDEIFAIADRYTVFRDGQYVGEGRVADVAQQDLIRMMVGRTLDEVFPKVDVPLGAPLLRVDGLSHPTEFDDISFDVRQGEILGFYGLVGAGRTELMEAIFGLKKTSGGSITIDGRAVRIRRPGDAIAHGIAYVPEDRQAHGAVLPMSIRTNIALPNLSSLLDGPFLNRRRERDQAETYGRRLAIKASGWEQLVEQLSGGNQQKVVISKWLATNPRLIILDEPTKGIDIGSKSAVHEFMGELVKAGLAVILVSSELEEILGMSDTVTVMHRGRIVGRFGRDEATREAIVQRAAGGH